MVVGVMLIMFVVGVMLIMFVVGVVLIMFVVAFMVIMAFMLVVAMLLSRLFVSVHGVYGFETDEQRVVHRGSCRGEQSDDGEGNLVVVDEARICDAMAEYQGISNPVTERLRNSSTQNDIRGLTKLTACVERDWLLAPVVVSIKETLSRTDHPVSAMRIAKR